MGVNLDAVFRKAEAVRNKEATQKQQQENEIPIVLLDNHPLFGKGLPFREPTQERLDQMAESIRRNGILNPLLVRRMGERYQILGGHTRKAAAAKIGYKELPCVVMDVDDDEAENIFVTDNLMQRPGLLPSEKAWAYRTKLEAMKRQAGRPSKENCSQVGNDFGKKSSEVLAEQVGQSKNQIFRYIRLTELIPELLDMVDEKKIALNPAYELSFLKKEEQRDLLDAMDSEQATPSLSQAQRLKKYSQEGHLTLDMMRVIMGEEKKSDLDKITFTSDTLRKYFPRSYTPQRMQETIIKLLEQWQRKRQQQHDR